MDHEIRRAIILKLIHNPRAAYNQLWDKKVESNAFAYHLKKLEEEGLVEKYDDGYGLTVEGKKQSAFIEGDTGGKAEMPTPTVIIMVRSGDRLLCQHRLKEPFHGIWGLPSGKINFGWNPKECAIRDLKEETDLVAKDATLVEIEYTKTFDEGKLLHHHIMWTYLVTEFTGTLKETTHKARNKFLTLEELEREERFPGDWSKRYFSLNDTHKIDTLKISEKERHIKDGKIVELKIISSKEYTKDYVKNI